MNWRWFTSSKVRLACDMAKHVRKLVNEQRDILSEQAISNVETACEDLRVAATTCGSDKELDGPIAKLEEVANKWLKPYPNATTRENVEVVLVAVAIALAVRTFFVQPFKIPTGSMQPTLYGITAEDDTDRSDVSFPSGLARVWDGCVHGTFYCAPEAEVDGQLTGCDEKAAKVFRFITKQTIYIDNRAQTVWFPPENLSSEIVRYLGKQVKKGETMFRIRENSGDHLFVDRVSYNFRRPKRGEIIVFATKGISGLQQDLFYIKRMVALGGETVSIGNDQHLVINGQRLDANTPHFENVYSFPKEYTAPNNQYFGHVNNETFRKYTGRDIAPNFMDETAKFNVPGHHYMAMGDNTMNSYDSRGWGAVPQENIMGKSLFVYWPITKRFGLTNH